jgi:hypothetical protein
MHRKRHGAGEAREAHNLDVPGSKPGAATFFLHIFWHLVNLTVVLASAEIFT